MNQSNFQYFVQLAVDCHNDVRGNMMSVMNITTERWDWTVLIPARAWALWKANRTLKRWNRDWTYTKEYLDNLIKEGGTDECVEVIHDMNDLLDNYKADVIEVFSLEHDPKEAKEIFDILTYGGRIT